MKFIGKSYSLYTKYIHQIWCRSAKFLWKSKCCSESGSGSGSWYYFGFQYQTCISYIEDTHQILFGSANSFESYCVHMNNPRTYVHPDIQTTRQTDGNFFWLVLSSKTYKLWTFVKRWDFFFHSCDYNTSFFYILRMWWESKKILKKVCRTKLNFMSIINIWNITIQKSITKWYPDPDPDRISTESENWLKLIDWKLSKSIIMHSLG